MQIHFALNHKKTAAEIAPDTLLIDLVRSLGCKSVKRGCETANCGLCTVFLDEKPVLSCSVLAARADGRTRHHAWRACRRKPLSSARSSLTRAPSSAASAIPAL